PYSRSSVLGVGIGVDARGVVIPHRSIGLTTILGQRIGQHNLAHGHADVGTTPLDIHLSGATEAIGSGVIQLSDLVEKLLWVGAHGLSFHLNSVATDLATVRYYA